MFKALTIAGSDCSGGAGIQADLKTFAAHGVYGMSVITAVTAQNTTGVFSVDEIKTEMVSAQMNAVLTDIIPDATKIGMVSSEKIIDTIVGKLKQYKPKNIILDPVMVATSGDRLFDMQAQTALIDKLMPLTDMVTPNIPEAEILAGFSIDNKADMIKAVEAIAQYYKGSILIKGGHLEKDADDLFYRDGIKYWLSQKRIDTKNTHGTGCTLSSAIAANLAMGKALMDSVKIAKDYVYGALLYGMDLGKGNGPLNHLYAIND